MSKKRLFPFTGNPRPLAFEKKMSTLIFAFWPLPLSLEITLTNLLSESDIPFSPHVAHQHPLIADMASTTLLVYSPLPTWLLFLSHLILLFMTALYFYCFSRMPFLIFLLFLKCDTHIYYLSPVYLLLDVVIDGEGSIRIST